MLSALDKQELHSGAWLTDKHVSAVNKIIAKQFPHQKGFEDTVVLAECLTYKSGVENFI